MAVDEATDTGARDPLLRWAAAAAAALLLAIAWPLLRGELYVFSDLGRFHVPVRFFYSRALAAGESFLWWPYEYMGFYLHGEGQGAFAHPLTWLQYRWLPFQAAFSLDLLRAYGIALPGTLALLVRRGLPAPAAAFGALLFAFGSFNFLHLAHTNFIAIVAHWPWLLLAADVALRGRSTGKIVLAHAALALGVASELLHAHPQATWMSFVVLAVYAFERTGRGEAGDPPRGVGRRTAALAQVGLAVALGFGIAAVQVLPQWEMLQGSYRADPGSGYSNTYALSPINWVQLVSPYLFAGRTVGSNTAGFACYAGAAVAPLVVWCWMRRRALGPWRRLAGLGAVFAALGLVLALGEAGGLYRVQQLLPVVGLFRAPGRYVAVAELGLAVVAAVAFADLARGARRAAGAASRPEWRALWPLGVPLGLSVALSAAIALPVVQASRPAWTTAGTPAVIAGVLLIAAATALVAAAARGRRVALVGLIVLTAGDLGAYGLGYVRAMPTVGLAEWAGFGNPPPVPEGLRLERGPAALTLREVRLAGGYAAMRPDRTLPVGRDPAETAGIDAATLRNARRVASVVPAGRARDAGSPMPRARLVAHAEVTDAVLDRLGAIDVRRTALVAEPLAIGPGPPGEARITLDRPGHLRIETDAPTARLLVVSERHHAGWRGDRGPTPCRPIAVYADLLGCVVPPGRHEVELVFEPWSFVWGRRVSLASLAFGGVLAAAWLVGARRRATAPG